MDVMYEYQPEKGPAQKWHFDSSHVPKEGDVVMLGVSLYVVQGLILNPARNIAVAKVVDR